MTARSSLRGLYAITPETRDTAWLASAVAQAVEGGARVVQYRDKSGDADLRIAQARAIAGICRRGGARLIINDDVALALDAGADGVHLGREDGAIAEARRRLPAGALLGASCYDRFELAQAALDAGADHVAFGAVYPSSVKPGAVRASLDLFRTARAKLDCPIIAIGGINADNAAAVIQAGADAVAVITAVFGAPDIRKAAAAIARLFPDTGKQAQPFPTEHP